MPARTGDLKTASLARQAQDEYRSASLAVRGHEVAALGVREVARDGKPEARASAASGAGGLGPVEPVEDAG